MKSKHKLLHWSPLLVVGGLLIQLVATIYWSPLTFVAFAAVGVPLVLVGSVLFLVYVWRYLREKGAL